MRIAEQQFGFMPGRNTTDAIFCLRMLLESGPKGQSLKVSRSKTEYLRIGGVDDGEELKLQGEKVKRAKNFKYLGSTVISDGRYKEEVRRRIQAGWRSWWKVSEILYNRKLLAKVKG